MSVSLYWTTQNVLLFLASTSDEPQIAAIAQRKRGSATSSRKSESTSKQYAKSAARETVQFDGLRSTGGHKIQDVRELMKIPVIVMSDMTKSPPVLMVYACELTIVLCSETRC